MSKFPPVKTGGIYRNRLCLSTFGGCFNPPVKTDGIEIGRVNRDWATLGRFGYKQTRFDDAPSVILLKEAESQKDSWPPLKSGLFGGSYTRFEKAYQIVPGLIEQTSWF